jgi:hypothetical protein
MAIMRLKMKIAVVASDTGGASLRSPFHLGPFSLRSELSLHFRHLRLRLHGLKFSAVEPNHPAGSAVIDGDGVENPLQSHRPAAVGAIDDTIAAQNRR